MDPYTRGMFQQHPYAAKADVKGKLVAVLRGRYPDRGLELIAPVSRAVGRGQVHELIITDADARPGDRVDPIAYIGFFAVEKPGVLVAGDSLAIAGKPVGVLAGFDETHMPNHLNLVVKGPRVSGEEAGYVPGDDVVFRQGEY